MSVLRTMMMEETDSTIDDLSFEGFDTSAETLEVVEGYNEIVLLEDGIDRLSEIHAGLESLLEISESSLEDGGLSSDMATILRISTEALVIPLGMESPILSTESFGGDGERLTSTRISIEEEKGTITKVWDAIVRSLSALRKKIANWIGTALNSADALLNNAKNLQGKINKLSGKPKDGKIKVKLGSLINNKQNIGDVVSNLAHTTAAVKAFTGSDGPSKFVKSALNKFKELDGKSLTADSGKQLLSNIDSDLEGYTKISSGTVDKGKSGTSDGAVVLKHKPFTGNKTLVSTYKKESLSQTNWALTVYEKEGDLKGSNEEDKLTKDEMDKIMTQVISLLTAINDYKPQEKEVKKLKTEITDAGKKLANSAKKTEGEKYGKVLLTNLKDLERMLDNPVNTLITHAIKGSNSAVSLVKTMAKAGFGRKGEGVEDEGGNKEVKVLE